MDWREGFHSHMRLHRRPLEQRFRSWHIPPDYNMAPEVLHEASEPAAIMARDSTATSSSSSAATTTCGPNDTSSFCQKPVSSSTFTLPIVLGIAIPLVGAIIVFTYLHRRHVRKQKQEDANDPHKSLDFGLGNVGAKGGNVAPDVTDIHLEEKPGRRGRQMSMDISSPYLLPIGLQNSRESLHSLSRTLHQQEDPYQHIQGFIVNDALSVRSASRQHGDNSSIYTGSSMALSRAHEGGTVELLGNAAGMPRSAAPSITPRLQASLPQNGTRDSVNNQTQVPAPSMQAPVIQRKELPNNISSSTKSGVSHGFTSIDSQLDDRKSADSQALRNSNDPSETLSSSREPSLPPPPPVRSPERSGVLSVNFMAQEMSQDFLPPSNSSSSNLRPQRKESLPLNQSPPLLPQPEPQVAWIEDGSDYGDEFEANPPPARGGQSNGQRYSIDAPQGITQSGLGVPEFDPRRISVGFRPLPPDTAVESDDPEIRANRIRSFYKEYFDDSKPAPQSQYYEDYDENYLSEATFYDPSSNSFVMPYAQPVTRRAMTPPPQAQRFNGQPPRTFHGSIGDLRAPRAPGPRAYSSASGRIPPTGRMTPSGPKRPLPPPAALNSLPTPSKLRDDSFALMNSIEFAPPMSYKDRQAGRSESPLGERRPYSPSVSAFQPLASPYEELPSVPSPYLLRKSGTFTGLDFAPPRKIKDRDTASDSGSIRSNRSGLSSVQANAIRSGAYRVSRLPPDMIFSKDEMSDVLKPTWNMRQQS